MEITTLSRVILDKLEVPQLVKIFPTFVTVFLTEIFNAFA
jgi:hypothetical protein